MSNIERGRGASLSPSHSPLGTARSTSRGRGRTARSGSRAPGSSKSRSRLNEEDKNYRWSILTHDPQERFKPKTDQPFGTPALDDDLSDEEQLFDDELTKNDPPRADPLSYDIMDIELPNYGASMNTYFRKKTHVTAKMLDDLAKDMEEKGCLDAHSESLYRRGKEAQKLVEVLALEKALEDAKEVDSTVPNDMQNKIQAALKELGAPNPTGAKTAELVSLENSKDKALSQLKKLIVTQSKKDDDIIYLNSEGIETSDLDVNKDNFRVSRWVTRGEFFDETRDPTKVDSIIVYVSNVDFSDSMKALQYAIGTLVKSGDVIYVIGTGEAQDLGTYERLCESVTKEVQNFLSLLSDPDFTLHVVIECSYRKYIKHFLDQVVKYLKPQLFVITYNTLVYSPTLSNYVTPCPFMVFKKKSSKHS